MADLKVYALVSAEDISDHLYDSPGELFDILGLLADRMNERRFARLVGDGYGGSNHHDRGIAFCEQLVARIKQGDK